MMTLRCWFISFFLCGFKPCNLPWWHWDVSFISPFTMGFNFFTHHGVSDTSSFISSLSTACSAVHWWMPVSIYSEIYNSVPLNTEKLSLLSLTKTSGLKKENHSVVKDSFMSCKWKRLNFCVKLLESLAVLMWCMQLISSLACFSDLYSHCGVGLCQFSMF